MPRTTHQYSQSTHTRTPVQVARSLTPSSSTSFHLTETDSFTHSLAAQTRSVVARLLFYTHSRPVAADEDHAVVELAPLAPAPSHPTRPQQTGRDDKMKFSQSLLFNAVPDWLNNYIA
jgi:hypothetical protein